MPSPGSAPIHKKVVIEVRYCPEKSLLWFRGEIAKRYGEAIAEQRLKSDAWEASLATDRATAYSTCLQLIANLDLIEFPKCQKCGRSLSEDGFCKECCVKKNSAVL